MRINTRRRRSRLAELVATPPGCVSRPLCWQRRPAYEQRVARRLVVRSVDAAADGVGFPSWSRWARDPRAAMISTGAVVAYFRHQKSVLFVQPPRSYPPVDSLRMAIPGFGEGPEFLAHRIRTRRRRPARVEDVELAGGQPEHLRPSHQPPGSHHRQPRATTTAARVTSARYHSLPLRGGS